MSVYKLFLCAFLLSQAISLSHAGNVVCYYGNWAMYRPGDGSFQVEDIPPALCTHVIYSFITAEADGRVKLLDPGADLKVNSWDHDGFRRVMTLKKANPALKILIAMGGFNEGSVKYSTLFSDAGRRRTFALNIISFMKQYGFDGLDLDWEYPAQRGGAAADRATFSELCRVLKEEFSKSGFLLTAAVLANPNTINQSYDVPAISKYLDFINVMAYDYHGTWESRTGHNAPIYPASVERNTAEAGFNVDSTIQAWIKLGAPASKLVLGVGMYGQCFTLSSSTCEAPRCPVSGAGRPGPLTGQAGFLGYNEICKLEISGAKALWDNEAQIPYLVSGNQWVSYDNQKSAQLKVDYIKKYGLGGAMVWSIDTDDFKGACGKGKYPLLTVLSNGMKGSTATPTTTASPSTSSTTASTSTTTTTTTTAAPATTTTTTTVAPVPGSVCTKVGYVRDPVQCEKFYYCELVRGKFREHSFTCSNNLVFDPSSNSCNYKYNVKC